MKKITKAICAAALAVGGICLFNRLCSLYATRKHLLRAAPDQYFSWRGLKVYYRKLGTGSPLILLHSIQPAFSSAEWEKIERDLAESHTVYALDLPGCGRSDKPKIIYTSVFYASLLNSFIQIMSLIGADIAAADLSCVTAVLAEAYEPGLLGKMIFINPPSPRRMSETPDHKSKLICRVFQLPLIGSFIYNILFSRQKLARSFEEIYLYNPFHDHEKILDTCFESAHLGSGKGSFLAGSLFGKYTNISIDYAAGNLKNPVRIIEGEELDHAKQIVEEWKKLKPDAESVYISHTRQFPHMEEPELTAKEISKFL